VVAFCVGNLSSASSSQRPPAGRARRDEEDRGLEHGDVEPVTDFRRVSCGDDGE